MSIFTCIIRRDNKNLNFFLAMVNLNRSIKNQAILLLPAITCLTISFNGNKCVFIKFEEKKYSSIAS